MLSDGRPLREPAVGDLVVVPVTGAYCYTMSNNYNGARRPPVVLSRRRRGPARRPPRGPYADLFAREVGELTLA